MKPTYDDIVRAAESRGDDIRVTPLVYSDTFSKMSGSQVYLKAEFQQKTGSFKIRGAHYKVQTLTKDEKSKGVVAASAGNHAQGVAYASQKAGIQCTIVMPKTASPAKISATREYGANVVLRGANYEEASKHAQEIADNTGATAIHAFDDPHIIAGQGVIGLEIMDQTPDVDEVYVPIGGGGLAAGVLLAIKQKNPKTRIIGVQTRSFPAMHKSLMKGIVTKVGDRTSIADGIAVRVPGSLTFSIIRELIDDIVLVSDADIEKTMFLMLERAKLLVEPAGAAALAYVITKCPSPNKKVVCIMGGGNVDMYLLGQIVDKGLAAMGRLLKVSMILPDRPGIFKEIMDEIAAANANLVEMVHDRLSSAIEVGTVSVTVSLETEGRASTEALIRALRTKNIQFHILT
ncbi:MAG: threonine ammonia-lyase [Cenarchaeum sp. SB0663_bin_5]|nr:threonine ammonia-lyase [Cenarchaeum sp. SB0663_bin_5]MYH03564.1 threonine ammonia-lyase [Cenarchaeum sp. SB0675_bin_21]MYL10700.1 threonine ammonia-lyase [Cenarchaeum sp. SB0669_bin_11]